MKFIKRMIAITFILAVFCLAFYAAYWLAANLYAIATPPPSMVANELLQNNLKQAAPEIMARPEPAERATGQQYATATPIALAATTGDLHARYGPGIEYSVYQVMSEGTEVQIILCRQGWAKIIFDGRQDLWANAKYLLPHPCQFYPAQEGGK